MKRIAICVLASLAILLVTSSCDEVAPLKQTLTDQMLAMELSSSEDYKKMVEGNISNFATISALKESNSMELMNISTILKSTSQNTPEYAEAVEQFDKLTNYQDWFINLNNLILHLDSKYLFDLESFEDKIVNHVRADIEDIVKKSKKSGSFAIISGGIYVLLDRLVSCGITCSNEMKSKSFGDTSTELGALISDAKRAEWAAGCNRGCVIYHYGL
jgi:hypothetical protein